MSLWERPWCCPRAPSGISLGRGCWRLKLVVLDAGSRVPAVFQPRSSCFPAVPEVCLPFRLQPGNQQQHLRARKLPKIGRTAINISWGLIYGRTSSSVEGSPRALDVSGYSGVLEGGEMLSSRCWSGNGREEGR
uniref:Uncharacterized protein n=1 Tax=Cyanoderma ruficeps TaxID=181631 RepID=A0A8C3NS28_9PASS